MIRLFISCAVFFLIYLGIVFLRELDTDVSFVVYDYFFETTLLSIIASFIILVFLSIAASKIIFLIFTLPFIIKKRLNLRKAQKTTNMLMQAISYILIDNKFKALDFCKKLEPTLQTEHKELFYLILAECEEEFDKKVHYFRTLSSSKDYNYFAAKRLSQIFYDNHFYEQSEDYATKVFNLNEFDLDILEILINCYAKLGYWSKFVFLVSKLSRVSQKKLSSISEEISEYYLLAAKYTLEIGDDVEAMGYIESALELNPGYLEALDLYLSLNLSFRNKANAFDAVKLAFEANPSFEIAELFIKIANSSESDIYDDLARIADPKKHEGLFLAIAARLNLIEKVKGLREPRLLEIYD